MSPNINVHSHMYFISKLSWLLVFTMVYLHRATQGFPLFQRIPNCGPSFSADPKNCVHGAFELNMNRTECEPRVVCYRNIGETCQMFGDGSNCLPPLVCSCYKCREVTSDLCRETVRSPFSMPKRMKPVYPEYIY